MTLSDALALDRRRAFWAAGFFVGMIMLAGLLSLTDRNSAPEDSSGGRVFSQVNASPGRIAITTATESYMLENDGSRWVLPERGGFPVRPDRMAQMLDVIETAELAAPRTKRAEWFEHLGLGDPTSGGNGARITILGQDETGIIAGIRKGRTYTRRSNENQVWLADRDFPALHSPDWWLDLSALKLPADKTVVSVEIIDFAENTSLTIRADKPELSLAEKALLEAGKSAEILSVDWYEAETMRPFAEHTVRYSDGTRMTFVLIRHQKSIWAEISGDALAEPGLFSERIFRLGPVSASELLP